MDSALGSIIRDLVSIPLLARQMVGGNAGGTVVMLPQLLEAGGAMRDGAMKSLAKETLCMFQ